MTFLPEGRELDLSQWSAVLALDMAGDALMDAYNQVLTEWANTPRWRFRKRQQLMERSRIYVALYWIVGKKAQEQDSAR